MSSGIFFTAVTTKDVVFWDIAPHGPSKKIRHFGGTHRIHPQSNDTLSLPSSQQGHTSRRTAKRTSTVVFILYRGDIVYGPLIVECVLISLPIKKHHAGSKMSVFWDFFTAVKMKEIGQWMCRCKRISSPSVLRHILDASLEDSESSYLEEGDCMFLRNLGSSY
jgi:hypothetical protein